MPSGAEMTVPIECDSPSEGMQSTVFDAAGHAPLTYEPSSTVPFVIVLSGFSVNRSSRETIAASESFASWFTS